MKTQPIAPDSTASRGRYSVDETLRMLAKLPAPVELEDRIQIGLHSAFHAAQRKTRLLEWPVQIHSRYDWFQSPALRAAAAAAIVCVVLGGGWSVYSRVQPAQTAKGIVQPQRLVAPGGFSNAGAMRQTLNGPALVHPKLESLKPEIKSPHASAAAKGHQAGKRLGVQELVPSAK